MIQVSSTTRDDGVLTAFRSVAPALYATDPVWAPDSEQAIDECLARSASGEIEMLAVVVFDDGRPVARAMGISAADADEGWVGLFECLPDSVFAGKAALERCVDWLRAVGRTSVVGPRVDELRAGLLIEGFDRPHTVFTAHNPSFYLDVFRSAGFAVRKRLVSFEFTRDRVPAFRHEPPGGIEIRNPDPSKIDDEIRRIEAFQDSVFGSRHGRVLRSRSAGESLTRRLLPAVDVDLVLLAEDGAGEIAGVLLCLPDVWQEPPVDRARLVSIGVAPGWRRQSVAMALGSTLAARLLSKGYRTLEASWIRSENTRPQSLVRALGATPGRVFALLEMGV